MKKLVIIFFALSLQGCPEPEEGYPVNRVLANESIYNLHISVWDSVLVQDFVLERGQKAVFEGDFRYWLGTDFLSGFGWVSFDSVLVIASDSLRVLYLSEDFDCDFRNPGDRAFPRECSGYVNEEIDGVRSSVFTFVDADFIDAVVIMD